MKYNSMKAPTKDEFVQFEVGKNKQIYRYSWNLILFVLKSYPKKLYYFMTDILYFIPFYVISLGSSTKTYVGTYTVT